MSLHRERSGFESLENRLKRNKQFVISYFEIWTVNPRVAGSSPVISLKPYMGERCSLIGRAGKYKKFTVTGILFLFYFEKIRTKQEIYGYFGLENPGL